MRDDDILIGSLMEDTWLTLEQVAAACAVEPDWLLRHIEEGLFPHAESVAGVWRFSGAALAARAAHAATRAGLRCGAGTGGADGRPAGGTGRSARSRAQPRRLTAMNPIDPAEAPQLWLNLDLLVPIAQLAGAPAHEIAPPSEFGQARKDGPPGRCGAGRGRALDAGATD